MKIERLAARRRQATTVARGAAALGEGSAAFTVRGLARTRTGRTRKGADFYQWRVTLKEGELRDGLARLRSPRPAGADDGANAKRWERPVLRKLPNRTIFYRLDRRASRRRAKARGEPK